MLREEGSTVNDITDSATTDGADHDSTGDATVDGILALLDGLEHRPVSEHAQVYLDLHAQLNDQLDPDQKHRQARAHGAP